MFDTPEEGDSPTYPTSITTDEKDAGFELNTIPNPTKFAGQPRRYRAAVCPVGPGKIAVKMKAPDGNVGYTIVDASTHRPVDHGSHSIAALKSMFGLPVPKPAAAPATQRPASPAPIAPVVEDDKSEDDQSK